MTAADAVRRHPFHAAEVGLVALVGGGAALYAGLVLGGHRGAWATAGAVLAAAALLGAVLAAHGVRDLARLVADDGRPRSTWRAVVGAAWRLLELGLVVAFVLLGVVSGAVAADLAGASATPDAEGTVGVLLGAYLLVEAALAGSLLVLVTARAAAALLRRSTGEVASDRIAEETAGTAADEKAVHGDGTADEP